jgi:hypothetical protein
MSEAGCNNHNCRGSSGRVVGCGEGVSGVLLLFVDVQWSGEENMRTKGGPTTYPWVSIFWVSVEHGFGKTMNLWSFNGLKRKLQVGLSPIAACFMVELLAVLLRRPRLHRQGYGKRANNANNARSQPQE